MPVAVCAAVCAYRMSMRPPEKKTKSMGGARAKSKKPNTK